MKIPNKVYDVLKWIVMILLPATNTLIFTISGIIGKNSEVVCGILSAVTVFLGALIGVSTYQYNKDK